MHPHLLRKDGESAHHSEGEESPRRIDSGPLGVVDGGGLFGRIRRWGLGLFGPIAPLPILGLARSGRIWCFLAPLTQNNFGFIKAERNTLNSRRNWIASQVACKASRRLDARPRHFFCNQHHPAESCGYFPAFDPPRPIQNYLPSSGSPPFKML